MCWGLELMALTPGKELEQCAGLKVAALEKHLILGVS